MPFVCAWKVAAGGPTHRCANGFFSVLTDLKNCIESTTQAIEQMYCDPLLHQVELKVMGNRLVLMAENAIPQGNSYMDISLKQKYIMFLYHVEGFRVSSMCIET